MAIQESTKGNRLGTKNASDSGRRYPMVQAKPSLLESNKAEDVPQLSNSPLDPTWGGADSNPSLPINMGAVEAPTQRVASQPQGFSWSGLIKSIMDMAGQTGTNPYYGQPKSNVTLNYGKLQ